MSSKIKIEKAALQDLESILQLQYTAYQSEAVIHNDYTIQPLIQTLEELTAEHQKGIILKAVQSGKIIGSVRAFAESDTVYIGKLIVHPDEQGKGLGTRLMAAIEDKLYRKRFELFTSSKSDGNLRLYEKLGYRKFREETLDSGIELVYLEKKYNDNSSGMVIGMSLGMAVGSAIGIIMDDIAFWIAIGMCLGMCVGISFGALSSQNKS